MLIADKLLINWKLWANSLQTLCKVKRTILKQFYSMGFFLSDPLHIWRWLMVGLYCPLQFIVSPIPFGTHRVWELIGTWFGQEFGVCVVAHELLETAQVQNPFSLFGFGTLDWDLGFSISIGQVWLLSYSELCPTCHDLWLTTVLTATDLLLASPAIVRPRGEVSN